MAEGALGYFAVTYEGGLKMRKGADLSSEVMEVLQSGYTFEASMVKKLSADVDMVKVSAGGWLVMRMGDLVTVEPVDGPRMEPCSEKFRVVYPAGMSFAREPRLDSERHDKVHACGTVVQAMQKITPPGSRITFVELQENTGFIFTGKSGALLERLNGEEVLERITTDGDGSAWTGIRYLRVIFEKGLLVRRAPRLDAPHIGKLLAPDRVFAISEVVRDRGAKHEFALLVDGSGWVRVRSHHERFVEPVDAPVVAEEDRWYRVVAEDGVQILNGASLDASPTRSLLLPGTIFLSRLQVRPPGFKDSLFAQICMSAPPFMDFQSYLDEKSAAEEEDPSRQLGRVHEGGDWARASEDGQVLLELVSSPVLEERLRWFQVVAKDGVSLQPSIEADGGALGADGGGGGSMSFGSYFVSQRSFKPAGSPVAYLQVGDGVDAEPVWAKDTTPDGELAVRPTEPPLVEAGEFWCQVVHGDGAQPRTAPHKGATPSDETILAPYSVLRATHLLRPPLPPEEGDADGAAGDGDDINIYAMLDSGGWLFVHDPEEEPAAEAVAHARLLVAPPLVLVGRRRYRVREQSASMRVVTGPHPSAPLIYLAQPGHEFITSRELRIFGDEGGVFLEMEDGRGWVILAADASVQEDLYLALQPLPLQDEEGEDDYFEPEA